MCSAWPEAGGWGGEAVPPVLPAIAQACADGLPAVAQAGEAVRGLASNLSLARACPGRLSRATGGRALCSRSRALSRAMSSLSEDRLVRAVVLDVGGFRAMPMIHAPPGGGGVSSKVGTSSAGKILDSMLAGEPHSGGFGRD